jgi:hypothetical protein
MPAECGCCAAPIHVPAAHVCRLAGLPLPLQAGKVQGNPAIGRYLADTVAAVPHFAKSDFERLFNDNMQVGGRLDGWGGWVHHSAPQPQPRSWLG